MISEAQNNKFIIFYEVIYLVSCIFQILFR